MMGEEISLNDVLVILKRHLIKIITWSLIGFMLSAIYTFFLVTPKYQSTSKIVVNQTQNTGQAITNNDIQTNLNLINTYQSIIQEPIILEDVLNKVQTNLTVNDLKNKISIQTQNNSLVFGITVSDENPYIASELANATADSFESKIGNILEVESVTILSQATPNISPVSPNITINLLLGIVTGLFVGVVIGLISEMMNKTVKDEKFVETIGWTNLGSVLEMTYSEVKDTRINKNLVRTKVNNKSSRRV